MAKKALIVGIDAYPPPNVLEGCVNDAEDWQATLTSCGFEDCAVILNERATKAAVMAALADLVIGARPGDSLAFTFNGHGSQILDLSGDEDDGFDETLCTVDWPNAYIVDDDLRRVFSVLPDGVSLDVFLDCCHSGTGTRLITPFEYKIRALPPILKQRPRNMRDATNPAFVPANMNHCLWASCASNQTSAEVISAGKSRGVFTLFACYYIRRWSARSRVALISAISEMVHTALPSQLPRLEATDEASELPPFTLYEILCKSRTC